MDCGVRMKTVGMQEKAKSYYVSFSASALRLMRTIILTFETEKEKRCFSAVRLLTCHVVPFLVTFYTRLKMKGVIVHFIAAETWDNVLALSS